MIEPLVVKKILRAFENKDTSTINSLILGHEFSPNALIPTRGVSLLHLIIGHQSENFAYKITKLFLRCGGDPNVQSSDGVTPTHVAAGWGRNKILHLLLINGGDPWMQDDEKKNAFNYAFEEQEWNTIELLHHFQQMYSAANFKQDFPNSKIKLDLQKITWSKGDETYACVPIRHPTKSTMTQTKSYVISTPSPPIQDKIKYFEPDLTTSVEVNCWKKPEKLNLGWSKDFYERSCEVVMNYTKDEQQMQQIENKPKTFISSVEIEASTSRTESVPEKCGSNSSPVDVRGQLLVELQEAVRRRSKPKMCEPRSEGNVTFPKSDHANLIDQVQTSPEISVQNVPVSEKANSYMYASNLKESNLLKSMSNFASQIMEKIERPKKKENETVDLCLSSTNLKESDENCETEAAVSQRGLDNIKTLVIPQTNSDGSTLYLTPYNSNISNNFQNSASNENGSNSSFVSLTEEYKYTDVDEGVILLEKKLLVTPTISLILKPEGEDASEDTSSGGHLSSSVHSSLSCNSDVLRCELVNLGYNPGPITDKTKSLYMKKLSRMKKEAEIKKKKISPDASSPVESPLLKSPLLNPQVLDKVESFGNLEEEMRLSFEKWTKRKWRGGTNKTSFNYLLLDPRISSDLPKRARQMTTFDTWKCFLSSIFYIGKGKRSRPYAHLYEAANYWKLPTGKSCGKILRIIDIWKEDLGVVCLQVFQNIIPVEAFTREAAMISAMGLSTLKNEKMGDYYGIVSTWRAKDKFNLGLYLLYKAMMIFLNEGERQIKPYDMD